MTDEEITDNDLDDEAPTDEDEAPAAEAERDDVVSDDAADEADDSDEADADDEDDSDDEDDTDDDEDDLDDDFDSFDDDEWDDTDEVHVARQKPELDAETKAAMQLRAAQSKATPTFRRQEWFRYKRLARTTWRRPKGLQSKQRLGLKYRGSLVRIGHRKVAAARGLHPSGFREVMVHRPADLEIIDPAVEAARVGRRVGGRKREQIHQRADELGVRVLNRREM